MVLTLFWIKIALRRTINLLKSSPVVVVWAMIIIAAFIFAIANKYIMIMPDTRILFMLMPFLVLVSFLKLFKNYHITPVLMRYLKSKFQNKEIHVRFFIRQAFINNIELLIFNIIAFNLLANKKYYAVIPAVTVFSLILSFFLMYFKNIYTNRRISNITAKRSKINPKIKTAIYDYLTAGFLSMAVLCVVLFLIVTIEFTKNINSSFELKTPSAFFIGMVIVLSVGFMGIIDSIPHINWKFQAILSRNDFKYHIKRTMLFLGGIFGWAVLLFIYVGAVIDAALLVKYLFCILVLFLVSVYIAFTISNMLTKLIILFSVLIFTVWISTLQAGFLAVLVLPVLAALVMAKNDYMEWFLS